MPSTSPVVTTSAELLGSILRAAQSGNPLPAWDAAAPRIEQERAAVRRLITAVGAPPVYGFNTLLGHMDGSRMAETAQDDLLNQHLVGTPEDSGHLFRRLMVAAKLQQASCGGSGLSAAAYQALRASFSYSRSASGAWAHSYSSGDVVPGAWMVKDLLEHELDALREGDLIALINGHWVGAAWGFRALLEALPLLAGAVDAAEEAARDMRMGGRQLPVSLRDLGPVKSAIELAVGQTVEALGARLTVGSANPHFTFPGTARPAAEARSGNQFLDYGLTFALTNLIQAQALANGLLQRAIQHWSDGRQDGSAALVQPPKVAQAILEQGESQTAQLPARFSGADSHGIEDLRDLATPTALQSLRLNPTTVELTDIWHRASGIQVADTNFRHRLEVIAFGCVTDDALREVA